MVYSKFFASLLCVMAMASHASLSAVDTNLPARANLRGTHPNAQQPQQQQQRITTVKGPTTPQVEGEGQNIAQAYTRPGTVAFQGGSWVGSDHLYNLGDRLGLTVELISPAPMELNDTLLREYILKKLTGNNLEVISMDSSVTGSLPPYLHFLVMAYPIEKNIIVYVGLRLFEPVDLQRVKLGKEVIFQAISWERQTMIETTDENVSGEIKNTVDDLTNTFIEKWKYFERLKAKPHSEPVNQPRQR